MERGEARRLAVLFALIGVAIAALLPFLPLLLEDRGMAADRIGVVIAVMALARLAASPVWGHLGDATLGRVRVLRISTVVSAFLALGFAAWAQGSVAILALATALSVFWSPVVPLGDSLAVAHLGQGRLTEYGSIRQWSSVSYAIAVLAFGVLLEGVGYTAMLVLFALSTVTILVWSLTEPPDRPTHQPRRGLGTVGAAFRSSPHLAQFLIGILLVSVGTTAAWQFLPLRIVGRGGGPFLVGVAGAIGASVEVVMMRSGRRLAERFPLRALFALGCVAYVSVFALWSVVREPMVMTALALLQGVGFGLTYPTMVIIVGGLVPRELQATGQGLMQTVGAGLAPILSAFFGGLIYARLGAGVMFAVAAALVVAGLAVVWFALTAPAFSRRTEAPFEPVPPTTEGTEPF